MNYRKFLMLLVFSIGSLLTNIFTLEALETALWDNYVSTRKAYEARKTQATADALWKAYQSLMNARTQPYLLPKTLTKQEFAKKFLALKGGKVTESAADIKARESKNKALQERAAVIWKQEAYKRMQQFSQDPLLITKFYPFLKDWIRKTECQAQINQLKKEITTLKLCKK